MAAVVMAGLDPLLSDLFYLRDARPNLDVAPESALALIRGLGLLKFRLGPDPG